MKTITVTSKSGNERKLDYTVEFAGAACAVFWLFSDAELFAQAAANAVPGAEYVLHCPNGKTLTYMAQEAA